MNKITIIIPVYNAETTLGFVFDSLEFQERKDLVDSILFINDNSTDNSYKLIKEYEKRSSYKILIINHNKNYGLASNYNEGISKCTTNLFILMHQDVVLENRNSINIIVNKLENSEADVVAVFPILLHPFSIWEKYNFWQKCLFSRLVNREVEKLTGKFDGFKKDLMLQYNIFFDCINHRTAGEDSDIESKFLKINLKIQKSGVTIIHVHNKNRDFNIKNLIHKEIQLSECYGVLIRKHGVNNFLEFLRMNFRLMLVIMLFIPVVNIFDIFIILIYSFLYTKNVFIYERKNPRIYILPIINIFLLFISTFFYLRGFIYGKQKL